VVADVALQRVVIVCRVVGAVDADAFRCRPRTDPPQRSAGRGRGQFVRIVRFALRVGAARIGLPVRHHGLLFCAVPPPGRHRMTLQAFTP
jgi:hypothetical protein